MLLLFYQTLQDVAVFVDECDIWMFRKKSMQYFHALAIFRLDRLQK